MDDPDRPDVMGEWLDHVAHENDGKPIVPSDDYYWQELQDGVSE